MLMFTEHKREWEWESEKSAHKCFMEVFMESVVLSDGVIKCPYPCVNAEHREQKKKIYKNKFTFNCLCICCCYIRKAVVFVRTTFYVHYYVNGVCV